VRSRPRRPARPATATPDRVQPSVPTASATEPRQQRHPGAGHRGGNGNRAHPSVPDRKERTRPGATSPAASTRSPSRPARDIRAVPGRQGASRGNAGTTPCPVENAVNVVPIRRRSPGRRCRRAGHGRVRRATGRPARGSQPDSPHPTWRTSPSRGSRGRRVTPRRASAPAATLHRQGTGRPRAPAITCAATPGPVALYERSRATHPNSTNEATATGEEGRGRAQRDIGTSTRHPSA